MIVAHAEGLNAKVIRTGSIFGMGQPEHQGEIARLVAAVTTQRPEIEVPLEHCDGYLYVTDAASSVIHILSDTLEHPSAVTDGAREAVVTIKNDRLSMASDILAGLMKYAPSGYSPRITYLDTDDSSCLNKAAIDEVPAVNAPLSSLGIKELMCVQDGLHDIMSSIALSADPRSEDIDSRKKVYSSVRCTGGHQAFPDDWKFYDEDYTDIGNRVCMFENVCLIQNRMIYFQHETEVNAPNYASFPRDKLFVFLSLTGLLNLHIDVAANQHVPHAAKYVDDNTWLFTLASYSFNFAHLLLDELYSALAAMDIFDIPYDKSRILYHGCSSHYNKVNLYDPVNPHQHPYLFEEPVPQICENNMKLYSKLVFGQEAVELSHFDNKDVCFKKLIMGQGYVLSSYFVDKQRAVTLRKGRNLILKNLGFDHLLRPKTLSIMILPKKAGFYSSAWLEMCDDVTAIVRNEMRLLDIPIQCLTHDSSRSVEDEIFLMQQATFVIAEHGTISFIPLYAQDGAVLMSVGTKDKLKDGQTLLYATHLHVMYAAVEERETMAAVIRLGLARAAMNFDIEFSG
jgi:hypothetical protein